jgi:hypothetical protein
MAQSRTQNYQDMSVDELRDLAKEQGIGGIWDMNKQELVEALGGDGATAGTEPSSGGDGGGSDELNIGPDSSKSLKYAQVVTSPDEEEERPGKTLATRKHDVIRAWAEERGASPATVEGTEHDDRLGVLRFKFTGDDADRLREVSWQEWFETFDARGLNFIYQEHTTDGEQSNFFRLDNPDREDA